jgi:hypothetical protein
MTEIHYLSQFLEKIETRDAQVSIIGLGYVGLPLAVVFAEAGYRMVGIDVDERKADAIPELIRTSRPVEVEGRPLCWRGRRASPRSSLDFGQQGR